MPSRRQSIAVQVSQLNGPRPLPGRGPSPFASDSYKDALAETPPALLRRVERAVRLFRREGLQGTTPRSWLIGATAASLRLDGISFTDRELAQALQSPTRHRGMCSARLLRLRNHLAILRALERRARKGFDLDAPCVLRWYTSLSCGLSISSVPQEQLDRLSSHLRPMNAATSRAAQAIFEAASVHVRLVAHPLFPGFNGLLARLLLQYHLIRSCLPPVRLDPMRDRNLLSQPTDPKLFARLLERVSEACETLIEDPEECATS
jgi:hypothetical protein